MVGLVSTQEAAAASLGKRAGAALQEVWAARGRLVPSLRYVFATEVHAYAFSIFRPPSCSGRTGRP
jgi:hypothetical protein